MQSDPSAPLPVPDEAVKKSKKRWFLLAVPVAAAVVGSGVLVATANAGSGTPIPGVIEAESYAANNGAQTEGTSDAGGGRNVGWLSNGDWMRYDAADLGAAGSPLTIEARVSSANSEGGTVEVRQGSQTGELLAAFPITKTGNWQSWVTGTANSPTTLSGPQTIVVNLVSKSRSDFVNINWLRFTRGGGLPGTPSASASVPGSASPSASVSASASVSPSVSVSPTPTGTTPQTGNGWVVMDQAKWAQELAAFRAITPKTPKERMVPEFHASCKISHTKPDDPIVFPGMAGASHDHTFWGNKTTGAASTPESLLAAKTTSCEPSSEDFSAYWVPTLLKDGKPIAPKEVTVYYGSRLKDYAATVPFPSGFRMIVGDAKQQTGDSNQFWCAGNGGETGRTANGEWPVCAPTAELIRQLTFPDCWDGVHLDSPDHKSHVGPAGNNGACSGKFPVAIPSISYMLPYPLNTDTEGVKLSSGTGFSMHGDFVNAWVPQALAERVRNCINQHAKCNAQGQF
ncbi:DUF1996 domain-containing protein [Catenuloplanes sp. NPDC051500]|uniref:DUF1996 domain-containing protein n=1 Tax=Catenuloplanes sp. NPDC051500 TaxID=3363959 RepID=UPI003789BEF8